MIAVIKRVENVNGINNRSANLTPCILLVFL